MRNKILRSARGENFKCKLLFKEMNEEDLPLMYSTVFGVWFVVSIDF